MAPRQNYPWAVTPSRFELRPWKSACEGGKDKSSCIRAFLYVGIPYCVHDIEVDQRRFAAIAVSLEILLQLATDYCGVYEIDTWG